MILACKKLNLRGWGYEGPWIRISHVFKNYGKGVRYIYFYDGGKDTEFWRGFYGVYMTYAHAFVHLKRTHNDVGALQKMLGGKDVSSKIYAIGALEDLGQIDSVTANLLATALEDKHYLVKISAARALQKIGTTTVVPQLQQALTDKEHLVRMYAAATLGQLTQDQKTFDLLVIQLKDKSVYVQAAVLQALAKYPQVITIAKEIIPLVQSGDKEIRLAALAILQEADSEVWGKALQAMITAKDARIKVAAIGHLGKMNTNTAKWAIPLLIKTLQDKNWRVKVVAAKCLLLNAPDDPRLAPELIKALEQAVNELERQPGYHK